MRHLEIYSIRQHSTLIVVTWRAFLEEECKFYADSLDKDGMTLVPLHEHQFVHDSPQDAVNYHFAAVAACADTVLFIDSGNTYEKSHE